MEKPQNKTNIIYQAIGKLSNKLFYHPILDQRIDKVICKVSPKLYVAYCYKTGKYKSLKCWGGDKFISSVKENFDYYLTIKEKEDKHFVEILLKDMILCNILYGINPGEYFIHDFQRKGPKERETYLPKSQKDIAIMTQLGPNKEIAFKELKDKYKFYQLAGKYFKREVCSIKSVKDLNNFKNFVQHHPKFIAKPINGRFGKNTNIYDIKDFSSTEELLQNLLNISNEWIIEELIIQDQRMSQWNPSSVNTIRIPSFRTKEGIKIFKPFMRMGRLGSVVDNGGSGGIMLSLESEKGKVCSEGIDELGHSYKFHPDSGISFEGWICPCWQDLIEITKEVHLSLPSYHKYVGFDFALSVKGWVLVEGNWGDFICQQATLHAGLKKEFLHLLNS